ncbi:serine/threonine-protein kinase [Nannocystis pusilla]|uniref:Serine/threonine-protein kinase PknK n=1 Tax=Nannocystis pusilla TaxID=889268 RepID=A0ABS7TYN5_9BACT|nr:serine/threonine-protein kinase [Nannocystis pusilla]MBZ5713313.1 serine/threonine-protein kinase PknK [Nannocystis pusilla]
MGDPNEPDDPEGESRRASMRRVVRLEDRIAIDTNGPTLKFFVGRRAKRSSRGAKIEPPRARRGPPPPPPPKQAKPGPPPPPPARATEVAPQPVVVHWAQRRSPPQQLGRFRLEEALGVGGQGAVYRAVNTHTGESVALKYLLDVDPAADERLKAEFRRMADIAHENLLTLYELGNDGDITFFTMELLSGCDLYTATRRDGLGALPELLRQLARGVHALHRAGRIHRDLKPENVFVTDKGRVVVLDFGLVETIERHAPAGERKIEGTFAYMAPEQAAGQLAEPASDWYAVGVILFEVLTGRRPFTDEALPEKGYLDAPRVSEFASDVAPELDDLVAGLLRRVPSERPGAAEILRWCAPSRSISFVGMPPAQAGLIERENQLRALYDIFDRVRRGGPACVDVVGDAGLGKTALVQRFTDQVGATGVVVLAGACSQRESVPFRAFDGLLDALARHLLTLPANERAAIGVNLGPKVDALVRLFPVFAALKWEVRQPAEADPDPRETRRQAFQGLKQLLHLMAERQTVVIALDNVQWGDVDSAHLFNHLLASPGVPPVLFIAAYRRSPSPMLREIGLQRTLSTPAYAAITIELAPLSFESSLLLARGRTEVARRIAREAGGNPALLRALAEEIERQDSAPALQLFAEGDLLRGLVRARLKRVSPEARELFARLVVARQTLPMSLLVHAGSWSGDLQALAAQLRREGLVQLDGEGDDQGLAPASEQFQQAGLQCFDDELIRRSHGDLAAALVLTNSGGPEQIARHLRAAGRDEDAAEHASSAAFVASRAFAFDRAAELYQLALECRPRQWILAKNCAEALVQAGRGAEAAPLFLVAAANASAGAESRLQRAAAEQFFNHGALARGSEILRPLLAEAGVTAPTSPQELRLRLTDETAGLVRRGFQFSERSQYELSRRELNCIDLTWIAGKGLVLNDPLQAGFFLVQCARMALDAGEPTRIARSLALCGLSQASRNHAIGAKMLEEALRVGGRVHDHYAIGLATVCRGILARSQGQWRAALADIDRGIQHLRDHHVGGVWESGLGQASAMASLEALGELRVMSARAESQYQRSQATGDMLSGIMAALYSALTLLAAGRPKDARKRVLDTEKQWPREGFHVQHLHALKIGIYCDLYERRPRDAWQRIRTAWALLEQTDFLRIAARRAEALLLRAKAGLAVLRAATPDAAALIEVVEQDIAQLESEGHLHLQADAHLLRAGLAACLGDASAVERQLHLAHAGFTELHMGLHRDLVERLLHACSGQHDARTIARLDAYMHMQDITDIDAWARVMSPGVVD